MTSREPFDFEIMFLVTKHGPIVALLPERLHGHPVQNAHLLLSDIHRVIMEQDRKRGIPVHKFQISTCSVTYGGRIIRLVGSVTACVTPYSICQKQCLYDISLPGVEKERKGSDNGPKPRHGEFVGASARARSKEC